MNHEHKQHKTQRQKLSKVSVHHEANYAKACWTKMPCFVYSKIMEAVLLVPVALEHLTSSGKKCKHYIRYSSGEHGEQKHRC